MVSKAGAASAGSVKNSPNMLTLPPPFVLIESGPSQPHAMAVSLSLSLSVSLSLSLRWICWISSFRVFWFCEGKCLKRRERSLPDDYDGVLLD